MNRFRARFLLWICLILGLLIPVFAGYAAYQDNPRLKVERRQRTVYHWYLARWADNHVVCDVYVLHTGAPTTAEVRRACGTTIATQWLNTPPCTGKTSTCAGLYLHFAGEYHDTEEVYTVIDPPQVYIELPDCYPTDNNDYRCPLPPLLRLKAMEPFPGERILSIHVTLANTSFSCDGDTCDIPLSQTAVSGADMTFWATSTLGDSSTHFQARLRVRAKDPSRPEIGPWYVTVLSTQWRGEPAPACAATWWALPPEDGLPDWLGTPLQAESLATQQPYTYLAGQLIRAGAVDASDCPAGGLLPGGAANPCGLERARPQVNAWQNRFDEDIWQASRWLDVPAVLLKNLFAQESQFWPNMVGAAGEYGLGQLSPVGADTLLLWSPDFFAGFCPQYLSPEACRNGYSALSADEQSLLRGATMQAAIASCPECALGVDEQRARESIPLFAHALQANCRQVNQMVRNITHQAPGWVSSYEDLWRFTLANYNAGSGCLSDAMQTAWKQTGRLDWGDVSDVLRQECPGVETYVEKLTR
ncbi:MAG: hypothetical protein D6755_13995 [Anaerolineae bacterium]|nr:MAG: hypothetical protein D6755_13995 [Anaerolineae bacterium]